MLKLFLFSMLTYTLYSSTLYLTTSSNPSRINPLLATDSASGEIANWIFNGLVKYDKNGNIVGDLAQSFKFRDNKTLIFKLRTNVLWHDKKPFSAKDVLFTYQLLKSKKIVSPYSNDFRLVEKLILIDDYTIEVHYSVPYFKALNIWMMGILPKHILENEPNLMTSSFNRNPIGTGSYRLKSMELSKAIILEANEDYFLHKPSIQTIHYSVIPDSSSRYMQVRALKSDIGDLSPLQYKRELSQKLLSYYQVVEKIAQSYTYLGFNLRDKKFKNKKTREAIALAINKKEIVDILFFGHGKPCYGPFLPDGFAYNKKYEKNIFDPLKSKKLLEELGFTTQKPLEFELITNSNNSLRLYAAQIIQYQLLKVGIKMSIRSMEWQAFLNMVVFPRKFEAVLLGWSLSLMPDAYSIWHSDGDTVGGYNFVGYHNDKVDKLIKEAQTVIKKEKLANMYKNIFANIVDDKPYIFLYIPNSITLINKKIMPIEPSLVGIMHNQIDWIKP
jgi:peptide/nickel transport system substrate-binding protein